MNDLVYNVVSINGKDYYSVAVFAELTKRSEQSVRLLIIKGNRVRRLKAMKMTQALFIERVELMSFPFCCAGRSKLVIRFKEDGSEYTEIVN